MKFRTLVWILAIAAVCTLPLAGCAPADSGAGGGGSSTTTGS